MEYETLNELLDIYPFVEKFNGKINSKLIDLIRTYNKIVKSLHIGDDYFKVYPIMLESGLLKELYVEELKSIVNLHLETGKSYEVLMSETVFSYEKRIADLKEKLLSLDMKPYYGSLAYMVERSKFVLDCARKVTNDAWSFVTSKEKFIDEAFPVNSQLVSFPVSYCYGDFKNSKLLLPQDVISQSVVNNLERNANVPYVYDVCVYNEIFLNSNAKVLGVFYTDKCQNVDMVREYAVSYGLPLVNLSLNELRSLNGFDVSKSK